MSDNFISVTKQPAEISLSQLEEFLDFSIIESGLFLGEINSKLKIAVENKYPNIYVAGELQGRSFDLVVSQWQLEIATAVRHTLVINYGSTAIILEAERSGLCYWPEMQTKLGAGYLVFRTYNFLKPRSEYFIQQLNSDDANHRVFHFKPALYYTSLQESFIKTTKEILLLSEKKQPATFVRASDGDYYFLRKIEIGSAKPGRRALTKSYDAVNIPFFRQMFWQNDKIAISIEPPFHNSWMRYLFFESFDRFFWQLNFKFRGQNTFKYLNYVFEKVFSVIIQNKFFLRLWLKIFASREQKANFNKVNEILNKHQTPMEVVYSLVPSKWIFKNFKNQIGIIAGEKKCELIELLMQRSEYREYVGMDRFTDYIPVPQKGAADNVEQLAKEVGEKIKNSPAKIFLVGVGSSKIALLPLLKQYSNAIFIDVGAGIDALAGVVCQERPYFCEWTDYRIKNYDYSQVDFMDQGNPAWNKPEYKTKWID